MDNKGPGIYKIDELWTGDGLTYFETAIGCIPSGNVMRIDTTKIEVGGVGQDIDFKLVMGTVANTITFDCGAASIIMGTSSVPFVNDNTDAKFISIYNDSGATSGDNRGIYNRLYFTGAGGGGESLRSYTDVVGVTVGTVHGAHISVGFGESTTGAKATGLAVAVRATLGLPSVAMGSGGTYAGIMSEIYSFGSAADPSAVTELSFIRCVPGGDATGMAKVEDKAYLLVYDGGLTATGNVFEAATTEANYAYAARCKINGVEMWMMFSSDAA